MAQDRRPDGREKSADEATLAAPDRLDPDDDVTSEISALVARAFDGAGSADIEAIEITAAEIGPHSVRADAFAPGALVDNRYRIVELVHTGGMGHVYKAVDLEVEPGTTPPHVAIKTMRPGLAARFEAREELEREAAIARSLAHPNVVRVFAVGEHDGQAFMVMEWLDGESLNALLRRKTGQQMAQARAWPLIEGAALGIQHAHRQGIVHADINPSNLFVTRDGQVKLLDFGVAHALADTADAEPADTAWVTRTYASPDVLSGLAPVIEDDVFSLACVAYRLFTGKHAFGGAAPIVAKHRGVVVEPVAGLPDDERDLIARALSYSREDRPGSITVFLRGAAVTGRHPPSARRQWPRIALAGAAVLAVAAVGSWWLFGSTTPAPVVPEPAPGAEVGASPPQAEAEPATAPADALYAAALAARDDGRVIEPAGNNARDLLRQVLIIAPDHARAAGSLRDLSDDFVRQADTALSADDPESAQAALDVAAATDPDNPAIAIVAALLRERGERELAEARSAVAAGDAARAESLLETATRYPGSESDVASLRTTLAEVRQEQAFLAALAVAEGHLAAGRLIAPAGDNARSVLADLAVQYPDDPRLERAVARLGERLLTRAAFATAQGEAADAAQLLDAVDALGILAAEVTAARDALAAAPVAADAPGGEALPNAAVPPDADRVPAAAEAAGQDAPVDTTAAPVAGDTSEAPLRTAALTPATQPPPMPAEPAPSEPEIMRLEDLGLERFVQPDYPRAARRRGIVGYVEVEFDVRLDGSTGAIEVIRAEPEAVFDDSAVEAVGRWRFAERDDVVRGRVTLRYATER